MNIHYDTFGLVPVGNHRFIIEASTLGLAPGQFPGKIDTTMGNGQPLVMGHAAPDGGYVYRQLLGIISVTVAND